MGRTEGRRPEGTFRSGAGLELRGLPPPSASEEGPAGQPHCARPSAAGIQGGHSLAALAPDLPLLRHAESSFETL